MFCILGWRERRFTQYAYLHTCILGESGEYGLALRRQAAVEVRYSFLVPSPRRLPRPSPLGPIRCSLLAARCSLLGYLQALGLDWGTTGLRPLCPLCPLCSVAHYAHYAHYCPLLPIIAHYSPLSSIDIKKLQSIVRVLPHDTVCCVGVARPERYAWDAPISNSTRHCSACVLWRRGAAWRIAFSASRLQQ
jgi:hypothetical protein